MPDEALMTYYTRLKQLSLTCEFNDADREIKSQIIQHGRSHRLRRKALLYPTTTLTKLLEMGKAMEVADSQAANLERTANVRHFKTGNNKTHNKTRGQFPPRSSDTRVQCRNCGGIYPHESGKTACPAYGKIVDLVASLTTFNLYASKKNVATLPAALPTTGRPSN